MDLFDEHRSRPQRRRMPQWWVCRCAEVTPRTYEGAEVWCSTCALPVWPYERIRERLATDEQFRGSMWYRQFGTYPCIMAPIKPPAAPTGEEG